jgi:uncharacterized protein YgiM (DUF1202 family)
MKLKSVVVVLISLWSLDLTGQDLLKKADSLFSAAKYTEARELYAGIYQDGQASPAMLLRMAFIEEGLDNYPEALFYLNRYYSMTANKKALEKMQEIAGDYELSGYEYSDMDFFLNLVHQYQWSVLGLLTALTLLALAFVYRIKQRKESPAIPVFFELVLLVMLALVINNFFIKPKAIINQDQTLLMSGPSSASEPVDVIQRGHKVSILEENELWVKINWEDGEGYIRKNRIKPI